jgi:hypothetical protein
MKKNKPKKYPHKVTCKGCANLLLLKSGNCLSLCVATVNFVPGPLRKKMDITGLTVAEKRNRRNNCKLYTPVSFRAWDLKRFILGRLNNVNKGYKRISIKEYPFSTEQEKQQKYIGEGTGQQKSGRESDFFDEERFIAERFDEDYDPSEERTSEIGETIKEGLVEETKDVHGIGGTDDNDESNTSDKG